MDISNLTPNLDPFWESVAANASIRAVRKEREKKRKAEARLVELQGLMDIHQMSTTKIGVIMGVTRTAVLSYLRARVGIPEHRIARLRGFIAENNNNRGIGSNG